MANSRPDALVAITAFPRVASTVVAHHLDTSIRIPVPVAACLVLLIVFAAWKFEWHRPTPAVVRVGIVTTKPEPSFYGLQPVAELRPRIIRSANAKN